MNKDYTRTPISDARNLGPTTAAEMQVMDIHCLEQIQEIGWEDFYIRYVELFPHRLNLNALTAILGAIEDQDWREVDPQLKAQAKSLIQKIKNGMI
ncbi:MAG: TfoX/Sxy family DNA transformation protein [Pseudomonadota bacterium]